MNECAVKEPQNRKSYLSISFLNKILFYVFLANVVFIPNDTFNLKIISLIILLIINIPTFINAKTKDEILILKFGFVLTSATIILSILLTGQLVNIRLGYPGYILLLYLVVKKHKIDLQKSFILIIKLLALFVAVMALADILKIVEMYQNPLLMWFAKSSNAMIGKGNELPIGVMYFMKTSPLFYVGLFYCLQKKQWIWGLLFSFVIVLSGTRANIIMLILAIVFYLCFLFPNKTFRCCCILAFLFIGVVLLIDGRVIAFFVDMFTRKASSDAVRDGHLQGIIEYWKQSPLNFIIGSGYSAEFYSYGVEKMVYSIELSYWNLLRQVGLILFIPMMVMYLYPAIGLLKNKANCLIVLAYLIYLIIAYTNPLLYSSTGVTFLLYMYWLYFNNKKQRSLIK